MAHDPVIDAKHARHFVERRGVTRELQEVVRAFGLVVDLESELAPTPDVVQVPDATAFLDQLARTGHDLALAIVLQVDVEQQQNLVLVHGSRFSFPRSESASPVKAPPGTGGAGARQEAAESYQSGVTLHRPDPTRLKHAAEGCTIGRMRKLLKWIIVTIGVTALVHWFRQRGADDEVLAPPEPADDPADDLRRKLAEARESDAPEEAPDMPDGSVEGRRADVHEQGQAALDEMKSPDES